MTTSRLISPGERFEGKAVDIRLVTLADCTERYVGWLEDAEINRYLETRWTPQTLQSVRSFVEGITTDAGSYLFAIIERLSGRHIGNIKVGPINSRHAFADISYFIGDRASWGKGYGSEAIQLASAAAFSRLGVRRLQAGLYQGNIGSARALEKAGYKFEATFKSQLKGPAGWEDHLWYVLFKNGEKI